ncbi:MAG: hypothetical protein SO154_07895, partial [Prevotella sp.]|nr:hypothetical protein [Prevotella sp.]
QTTNNQTTKQPTTHNRQPTTDNKTTYLYIFLFIDISFLNLTPNILFISKILGSVDFLYYLCVRITIHPNLLTE